jgi:hypothetical protein
MKTQNNENTKKKGWRVKTALVSLVGFLVGEFLDSKTGVIMRYENCERTVFISVAM